MAGRIPKEGQVQFLRDALAGGSLENWHLRLFSTAHTPAVTDTLSTMTAIETSGIGYTSIALTRSVSGTTWATPAATGTTIDSVNSNAKSVYGSTTPSFAFTGSGTIYGYFVSGDTNGKLMFFEQFSAAFTVSNGSNILVPVELEFGSDTH